MKGWYNANMAGQETITRELLEALWAMVNCFAPYKGIGEEAKEAAVKYANEILEKVEGSEGE